MKKHANRNNQLAKTQAELSALSKNLYKNVPHPPPPQTRPVSPHAIHGKKTFKEGQLDFSSNEPSIKRNFFGTRVCMRLRFVNLYPNPYSSNCV